MRKKIFVLYVGVSILLLSSCFFEDLDYFPESSADRMNNFVENAYDMLTSAENGWVVDYFTINAPEITYLTQTPLVTRGWAFIMKFEKNEMVRFASKHNAHDVNSNAAYRVDSCLFAVMAESGPILTFNSASPYNDFHVFSDPKKDGVGYGGDYEFIILEAGENQIRLKGKKNGTYVYLNKLAIDYDWEQYFEDVDYFHSKIFGGSRNDIYLVSSGTTLETKFGAQHRFTFRREKEGIPRSLFNERMPFIMYPDGIRFQHPYKIDEKVVQTFKINDDWSRLECVDAGSTDIFFEGPIAAEFYGEEKAYTWEINIDEETMGSKLYQLIERMKADCLTWPVNGASVINRLTLYHYGGPFDKYGLRFHGTINANGVICFTKEYVGDNKIKFTFANDGISDVTGEDGDNNGKIYLYGNAHLGVPIPFGGFESFRELANYFNRTFIVEPNEECTLNLRVIKITAENDPEISCFLTVH